MLLAVERRARGLDAVAPERDLAVEAPARDLEAAVPVRDFEADALVRLADPLLAPLPLLVPDFARVRAALRADAERLAAFCLRVRAALRAAVWRSPLSVWPLSSLTEALEAVDRIAQRLGRLLASGHVGRQLGEVLGDALPDPVITHLAVQLLVLLGLSHARMLTSFVN